jgi:transposase-like protein
MIRVFELFCKFNFINLSAEELFLQSMAMLCIYAYKCPFCMAEHPDWKKHAVYERYLISFKNGHVVSCRITIVRYKCSSCGHTHAILPESIIPYQSYSFLFIIAVLRDYFTKSLTVEDICNKYNISVSTLYSWKKLFQRHKKIWLGLLEDACISSMQFLDSLFNENLLNNLKEFFLTAGVSFLQCSPRKIKAHSAPA